MTHSVYVCDIPFMKKGNPEKNFEKAVEAVNTRLEMDMGVALNIETITRNGLFGGLEAVGLRLWYRPVADAVPVRTIAEAIVGKWGMQVNDYAAAVEDVARALQRERQSAAAKG